MIRYPRARYCDKADETSPHNHVFSSIEVSASSSDILHLRIRPVGAISEENKDYIESFSKCMFKVCTLPSEHWLSYDYHVSCGSLPSMTDTWTYRSGNGSSRRISLETPSAALRGHYRPQFPLNAVKLGMMRESQSWDDQENVSVAGIFSPSSATNEELHRGIWRRSGGSFQTPNRQNMIQTRQNILSRRKNVTSTAYEPNFILSCIA